MKGHLAEARAEAERVQEENGKLQSELQELKSTMGSSGVEPLETVQTPDVDSDPIKVYEAKIKQFEEAGIQSPEAHMVEHFPRIQEAYIRASNQ